MTPTDRIVAEMAEVVERAWMHTLTTKSDFAREYAPWVAACASEGFITNRIGSFTYTNQWLPTPVGLEWLQEHRPELEF